MLWACKGTVMEGDTVTLMLKPCNLTPWNHLLNNSVPNPGSEHLGLLGGKCFGSTGGTVKEGVTLTLAIR